MYIQSNRARALFPAFRNNLEYVTEDRDRLRRKCAELELLVRQLRARECDLEEETTRYMRIIRSLRARGNEDNRGAAAATASTAAKVYLAGPSGDSGTSMQNEQ